jgi:hypothetical protein
LAMASENFSSRTINLQHSKDSHTFITVSLMYFEMNK